jgi:hypothetical protein
MLGELFKRYSVKHLYRDKDAAHLGTMRPQAPSHKADRPYGSKIRQFARASALTARDRAFFRICANVAN